jgi:hypothetical protein
MKSPRLQQKIAACISQTKATAININAMRHMLEQCKCEWMFPSSAMSGPLEHIMHLQFGCLPGLNGYEQLLHQRFALLSISSNFGSKLGRGLLINKLPCRPRTAWQ